MPTVCSAAFRFQNVWVHSNSISSFLFFCQSFVGSMEGRHHACSNLSRLCFQLQQLMVKYVQSSLKLKYLIVHVPESKVIFYFVKIVGKWYYSHFWKSLNVYIPHFSQSDLDFPRVAFWPRVATPINLFSWEINRRGYARLVVCI